MPCWKTLPSYTTGRHRPTGRNALMANFATDYEVIARRGTESYLLLDKRNPTMARVLRDGEIYPLMILNSILARGYWEEASMSDAEYQALLEGVTIIHDRSKTMAEERTPTEADIERWTAPITADPNKLSPAQWRRVLEARQAWRVLHTTGNREPWSGWASCHQDRPTTANRHPHDQPLSIVVIVRL